MSDAPVSRQASHAARLNFERIAGYGMAANVLAAFPLGMVSDHLAARVAQLAPAIATMFGVLAATMGASWFRGAHDERLNSQQGET